MEEIYTFCRILSIQERQSESVHFVTSTFCQAEHFSFVAAACSNGFVVLRYSGVPGDYSNSVKVLPVVRFLPWISRKCERSGKNSTVKGRERNASENFDITSLAFNENGRALFILCKNGSVYSIPALALIIKSMPSVGIQHTRTDMYQGSIGDGFCSTRPNVPSRKGELLESYARATPEDSFAEFQSETRENSRLLLRKGPGRLCVQFWRSCRGNPFLLIGTVSGRLLVVQCNEENYGNVALVLKVCPSNPIHNMKLADQNSRDRKRKFLFLYAYCPEKVTTKSGVSPNQNGRGNSLTAVYRLLLEQTVTNTNTTGWLPPLVKSCETKHHTTFLDFLGVDSNFVDSNREMYSDFLPKRVHCMRRKEAEEVDSEIPTKSFSIQSLGPTKGACIGIQNKAKQILSLYSMDGMQPQEHPLFQFAIPNCNYLLHTKKILFAVSHQMEHKKAISKVTISLYSSLIRADNYSGLPGQETKNDDLGKLQQFSISNKIDISRSVRSAEPMPLSIDFAPWCTVQSEDVCLEGIIIVARDAIYEVRPKPIESIEKIFYKLVEAEGDKDMQVMNDHFSAAESLSQSVGLNVLSLYKHAADNAINLGQSHAVRALHLYRRSNASQNYVLKRLILCGRTDVAAYHASYLLSTGEIPAQNREELAHLTIKCFLSLPVIPPKSQIFRNLSVFENNIYSESVNLLNRNSPPGLTQFLEHNRDYDLHFCANKLGQAGMYGPLLVAAHSRENIAVGLNQFLEPLAPRMKWREMQYLVRRGYLPYILGSLYTSFPIENQLHFLFLEDQEINSPLDLIQIEKENLRCVSRKFSILCLHMEFWGPRNIFIASQFTKGISSSNLDNVKSKTFMKHICHLTEYFIEVLLHSIFHMRIRVPALSKDKEIQNLIEEFICINHKKLRTQRIGLKCADFSNWICSAILYENQGDHYRALLCKLFSKKYENGAAVGRGSESSSIIHLLEKHILRIPVSEPQLRKRALKKFLSFLCGQGHPIAQLEEALIGHLDSSHTEISEILFSGISINPNSKSSKPVFSRKLYFQSCRKFLFSQSCSKKNPQPQSNIMLLAISANLANGIIEHCSSLFHVDTMLDYDDESTKVFSCGHMYPSVVFYHTVLKRFKQNLDCLNYTLPASFFFILQEYDKDFTSLVCPVCLTHHLEDEDRFQRGNRG